MGADLLEIGVEVRKCVVFVVRGCYRSVCNHPFLVGMLCFLLFLYRSSPFIFQLLVSASPILVCTAVLLGTLLSFGQPNIPEIEIEEKTTFEAESIKSGVFGDATVIQENESHLVERLSENRWDAAEKSIERPELHSGKLGEVHREDDSDDAAPLIEESEVSNGEKLGGLRYEEKTEWIEERLNNLGVGENHHISNAKVNDGLDDEKSDTDSFGSEKVNVDTLDSPPRSPWARGFEREEEEEEPEKEQDEDEDEEASDSDSDSDRAESSSPDASLADIMPMLDELHPLLDGEAPQAVHLSRGSSDAASMKSMRSSATSHQSDNESENHEDLEVADDENEDGEDEEDAEGDKDEETKSAITWTEEDQKNLMDLGSSEIERNLRLENLILRRRARKNTSLLAERNLIDFESSDLPFNIAPISTKRQNPFDLPLEYYDNTGLPPIPGSAPSILLPRQNPFDIPYDSSEEKPDLKGDGFQEEFTAPSRESFFKRHESFNVGPSIFAPKKQDVKMRPYFVPERTISEESSTSLFQRQSSGLSDSKVSSVPETESVTSLEDLEDKKLLEREVVQWTKEVTQEGPSGESELICQLDVDMEEDCPQEQVMIYKMETVSEHIGHGSQSSEEEDSLEFGQVEKDGQLGESLLEDVKDNYEQGSTTESMEVGGFRHGSNSEAVEPKYSRDSSSSSLSEVSERVFIDTEGEGLSMSEEIRADGAEEPLIPIQTHLGSTLDNNISHRAPVYDLSPRELCKTGSSSSLASDVLPQFDLGSVPVLDKITISSTGRGSEGSNQEIETDIPCSILSDSSISDPVRAESRPIDVDIRKHENVNIDLSGVDQRSVSEDSPAAGSFTPDMSVPLISSGEALMEEHILDEISVAVADKNIHTVVGSSEDQDQEQVEENHLLQSGEHGLIEATETQFEDLPREEHSDAADETDQPKHSDADIQHETDEKLTSTHSTEANTSLFYDSAIQEPDFNYLSEVQASSTPVESFSDGHITWDLNIPEVQELDSFINSPSSPKFDVDVQTIVEEADETKEIDEGLLSELDSVGDFSAGQLRSETSEFEKDINSVGEERLSSVHHSETSGTRVLEVQSVEVNKIEHLMHTEESKEDISVYEQEVEHISELLYHQTSRAENIEVSEKDNDCLNQETSVEEILSKGNKVLPAHSLVSNDHKDTTSGTAEMEDVGIAAKKAELASLETEVVVGVAEVSCQDQVDAHASSGMPELKASSVENIDLAFNQNPVLDPPQSELQNHEDTISTIPESEVLSVDDIYTGPNIAESKSVETEIVVGVSCEEQVETVSTSSMTETAASTVEDIDLAFKGIRSEALDKPLGLDSVDRIVVPQMPTLEASKTEDVDLVSSSDKKHVVLELPHAEFHNHEDTDCGITEQEPQLPDVHAAPEHTLLTSVDTEMIMEDSHRSSQDPVNKDAETSETEASTVELDVQFEQIISKTIEEPVDLEPVGADTTSEMPEIGASSVEAINLAFKHIGSEEIKNHDVLEPHQPDLVAAETKTENTEDPVAHRDTSVAVSSKETSVLDACMDDKRLTDSIAAINVLHDSVDITEDAIPHRDSSVMVANMTPKDAALDQGRLTDILHDSVDCILPTVESEETQGVSSKPHVAEVIPLDVTALPPNQVLDGETPEQLKLKSDDESVEVKTGDTIGPCHEDEASKELQSPSFVKGKGKLTRSSSSSSSSSSNSSDSDK